MTDNKRTETSSFGSPGRRSHDASAFYRGRLYQGRSEETTEQPYRELPIPETVIDQIQIASSENMEALPDTSVHLRVTSPPYNVGKDYDEDLSLSEYLEMLAKVFQETYRVLVPGGRACVNIANLGRKPYIPLHTFITHLLAEIGFLQRGEIIWDKAASVGSSTAWGSWMSASNPTLRDVHEYVLVFSKGTFKRQSDGRSATISRDEFLEYTKSIWKFPTASARRVGHPAPFPVELPYRLIQLYTFTGETVLDPFMGSGSTALAAIKTGRRFVGYEIDPTYAALAESRIQEFQTTINSQTMGE